MHLGAPLRGMEDPSRSVHDLVDAIDSLDTKDSPQSYQHFSLKREDTLWRLLVPDDLKQQVGETWPR